MYSRSDVASRTVSSILVLTTSPIDMMPHSLPSSMTGMCRKRPQVIVSIRSSTVSVSLPVEDVACHMHGHAMTKCRHAVFRHSANNVAFGEYARYAAIVIPDNDRTDATAGQHARRLGQYRLA